MLLAVDYQELIEIPRATRFPIELVPPAGFDPARLETWPSVIGRLEYVEGRLLFMPPCGDKQQYTVTDIVIALGSWVRTHRGYLLGTNEAGMRLAESTRAADVAIWRRDQVTPPTGGLQRRPPLLAVEVAGRDESSEKLREKGSWYLSAGVTTVWIVLPDTCEVIVLVSAGEMRLGRGEMIPEPSELPGLHVAVRELFVQIESWSDQP